jgi:hypothetical protein
MSLLSGVYPASQRQTLLAVCAIKSWLEFARQLLHAAEPLMFLYCDARHAKQGPPSSPVYPGLHTQAVEAVCADKAWPRFSVQGVHPADPLVDLYVEAGHARHPFCGVKRTAA